MRAKDTLAALYAEIACAELYQARSPICIRVTDLALSGSIVEVPAYDAEGNDTGDRELRVTPGDWDALVAEMPMPVDARQVTVMGGVPVLVDPLPHVL